MSIDLVFWTDFADAAIMLPLGIAMPLVLGLMAQRRAAFAWTVAIGCVWSVMLVLKLSGYTIAAMYPDSALSTLDLVTPSGHVASASAIYGGLLGLLLARPGTLMARSILAAIAVAIAISLTRILLGAHSLAEVMVGGTVGVAGAAGLAWIAGTGLARRARLPVIATTLLVIVAYHGDHSKWEETIRDVALWITRFWSENS